MAARRLPASFRSRAASGGLALAGLAAVLLLSGNPLPARAATPALISDNPVTVPDELDLGIGTQDWYYRETAGDGDNAGLLEGHLRTISYWGPVILGADLSYMGSYTGRYTGSDLITGAPLAINMAETVFQSAVHLGVLVLNTPYDALGLWASWGYHQQIWMTPAQSGGYEENYQIPYLGGSFYNQNPVPGTGWTFYEEGGYRSGLSPSMTATPSSAQIASQTLSAGTFNLGSAWNLHGLAGVRYLFTPHVGLYLTGNYSYWAFTQSTNTIPAGNHQLMEPSSITSYFGVESGVTLEY